MFQARVFLLQTLDLHFPCSCLTDWRPDPRPDETLVLSGRHSRADALLPTVGWPATCHPRLPPQDFPKPECPHGRVLHFVPSRTPLFHKTPAARTPTPRLLVWTSSRDVSCDHWEAMLRSSVSSGQTNVTSTSPPGNDTLALVSNHPPWPHSVTPSQCRESRDSPQERPADLVRQIFSDTQIDGLAPLP